MAKCKIKKLLKGFKDQEFKSINDLEFLRDVATPFEPLEFSREALESDMPNSEVKSKLGDIVKLRYKAILHKLDGNNARNEKRKGLVGLIKPTIEDPFIVVDMKNAKNEKRFYAPYIDPDDNLVHMMSISVDKGTGEYLQTVFDADIKKMKQSLEDGEVVYSKGGSATSQTQDYQSGGTRDTSIRGSKATSGKGIIAQYSSKWDELVEGVFNKAGDGLLKINEKYDDYNLLTNSKAQKQLHEVIKSFEVESNKIYTSASELKLQLEKLTKEDSENIVKALNGDLDPFELNDNHRAVHDKFRTVIDKNAQDLVDAGALADTNKIKDYLKRYYKEHLETRNAVGKMFFNQRFKKRKNLTYDERIALGMIEDASLVIPQTIAEQRGQLLKANTLKAVADKFAQGEEFDGSVKVPNNTVSGGVYKYGALAGKYVRADIFDAVNQAQLAGDVMNGFGRGWFKLVDHIKVNVTVKNPVTHLYNIGSNVLLAGLNGDLTHLAKVMWMAANDKKGFDALLQKANDHGLNSHRDDFEGVDAVMDAGKPHILKSLYRNLYMTQNSTIGKGVRKLYDWEDKIFKLASFKKHLEAGRSTLEAYNLSSEVYVDYSTPLPTAVRFVDKTGVMPFLHYVYKSTPATMKVIAKNPIKYMVMQSALVAFGASSYINKEEDDYKPEWAQDNVDIIPNNLFATKEWINIGNGYYLNAGRMIPAMKFGGLDLSLDSGFGFVGGFVKIMGGKTPLGYDIAGKYDSDLEKAAKKFLALAENYLPPLSFGRYGQRSAHIALGEAGVVEPKKNYYDEDMTVAELASRAVGVRKFNEEKEVQKKATVANSERKFKNKNLEAKDWKEKRINEKVYKERFDKLNKSARKKRIKLVDKSKKKGSSKIKIKPKFNI